MLVGRPWVEVVTWASPVAPEVTTEVTLPEESGAVTWAKMGQFAKSKGVKSVEPADGLTAVLESCRQTGAPPWPSSWIWTVWTRAPFSTLRMYRYFSKLPTLMVNCEPVRLSEDSMVLAKGPAPGE